MFLSTFPFSETGVSGGWSRVSEDLGSRFLSDGEQVKLPRILSRLSTGLWRLSSSRTCRFSLSCETGVPAGWTRVSEDLGLRVLERRRGRINSRGFCRSFLFDFEGFQFLGLADFLVLPRPECQLAGLASPRASVFAFWSDGEAGVTLVVFFFLASSFSESMDFYDFGVCCYLGDGEAD